MRSLAVRRERGVLDPILFSRPHDGSITPYVFNARFVSAGLMDIL
jgi:hypothetical protein